MKTIRFILSVAVLLLLTVNQGFTQSKVTIRATIPEKYGNVYIENIRTKNQKFGTWVLGKKNNFSVDLEINTPYSCTITAVLNGFTKAEGLEISEDIKEVNISVKEGNWQKDRTLGSLIVRKFSLKTWTKRLKNEAYFPLYDSCLFVFDSTKTFKESFRNYQQQFYNQYQKMKYNTSYYPNQAPWSKNWDSYLGYKSSDLQGNWVKQVLGMKTNINIQGKKYPQIWYLGYTRPTSLTQTLQKIDENSQANFNYLKQIKDSISQNLYKQLFTDVIFDNYNQKLDVIQTYKDHSDTLKLWTSLKHHSYSFLERAFVDTCIYAEFRLKSEINPYWADLNDLLKEKQEFEVEYKKVKQQTNTNPEMEKAQHIYNYLLDTVAFNKTCYSTDSYQYNLFYTTWLNYKKGQFRKQDTTISELKDKYLTVQKYLQGENSLYFLGKMLVMLKAKDDKDFVEVSKDYLKNYKDDYYSPLISKRLYGVQEVKKGKKAPNFTAKNLLDEQVQLKDLRGKWVCLIRGHEIDTIGQGKLNLVFLGITMFKPVNVNKNLQWYISDKENNEYYKYYQSLPYAAILIDPKGNIVHFFDYDNVFPDEYRPNNEINLLNMYNGNVSVKTIEALIKKK